MKTETSPTQILKRTAQQATSVPPVSDIQLENQYDEHFDFNFDDYEDDSKIHPCMANCIQQIQHVATSLDAKDLYDAEGNIII